LFDHDRGIIIYSGREGLIKLLQILAALLHRSFRKARKRFFCGLDRAARVIFIAKGDAPDDLLISRSAKIKRLLAVRLDEFTIDVMCGDRFHDLLLVRIPPLVTSPGPLRRYSAHA